MITIIFGKKTGVGKTSLNTFFFKRTYVTEGDILLERSRAKIEAWNKTRSTPLTLPDKPPIFTDFAAKLNIGYEEVFYPYWINGYYFGLPNDRMPAMQFLPSPSRVFMSEVQRYFDSRKTANFPDHVSRAFEMHRHFDIEFVFDTLRIKSLDPNVREYANRFIEVQQQVHERNETGEIVKTIWYCREWDNWSAVDEYLRTNIPNYKETTYINEGNIFDCYNSFANEKEFIPPEGKDFSYLPPLSRVEVKNLPSDVARFYNQSEPPEYRTKTAKPKKE